MENQTRPLPLITPTSNFPPLHATATPFVWSSCPVLQMTLQSPQLSPRLQLCEDMTWEVGKGYRTCLSITKKVQCAACTPGLTVRFTLQACMSGGQRAIPVSTLPFTSLFAPLPLLKQSRNLVDNYQNVMGKKSG